MGVIMKNKDWKCCDCPKSMAHKHEELWSFTQYGGNIYKYEDYLEGNDRCEVHFAIAEKKFDEMLEEESK